MKWREAVDLIEISLLLFHALCSISNKFRYIWTMVEYTQNNNISISFFFPSIVCVVFIFHCTLTFSLTSSCIILDECLSLYVTLLRILFSTLSDSSTTQFLSLMTCHQSGMMMMRPCTHQKHSYIYFHSHSIAYCVSLNVYKYMQSLVG